jgi:hypothetical protein
LCRAHFDIEAHARDWPELDRIMLGNVKTRELNAAHKDKLSEATKQKKAKVERHTADLLYCGGNKELKQSASSFPSSVQLTPSSGYSLTQGNQYSSTD